MTKYLKITKYLNILQKIKKEEGGGRPSAGDWGRRRPGVRARGARRRERRGQQRRRPARGAGGGARGRQWRLAQGVGGGGGGDGGVQAFRNETEDRRKRSASGFKAQVYSSVNRQIYLGLAAYIRRLPRNIHGRFIG
jgi:hypothetical protein